MMPSTPMPIKRSMSARLVDGPRDDLEAERLRFVEPCGGEVAEIGRPDRAAGGLRPGAAPSPRNRRHRSPAVQGEGPGLPRWILSSSAPSMVRQTRSISGAIRCIATSVRQSKLCTRHARCQSGLPHRLGERLRRMFPVGRVAARCRRDLGLDIEADVIGLGALREIEHLGQRRDADIVGALLLAKARGIGACPA